MNQNRNYKFFVLGTYGEYYDIAYEQLNHLEDVYFENKFPWNKLVEFMFHVHFSKKINRFITLPFKKIWVVMVIMRLSKIVNKIADYDEKICFLFFRSPVYTYLLKYDLIEKIKKKYPNSKSVLFCQDLVSICDVPIDVIKKHMDLVLSYDQEDAKKYNLLFYNIPYSDLKEILQYENKIENDVYFTGLVKNRYQDIITVFEKLTSSGLKCDFNLIGVPEEQQKYKNQINYCDGISYIENLKKANRARCILEVIQKNSVGNTIRVNEAIMLDKLLISNNLCLKTNNFFDERYMRVYIEVGDKDIDFIRQTKNVNYKNKEKLYPENLLNFIDTKLKE